MKEGFQKLFDAYKDCKVVKKVNVGCIQSMSYNVTESWELLILKGDIH